VEVGGDFSGVRMGWSMGIGAGQVGIKGGRGGDPRGQDEKMELCSFGESEVRLFGGGDRDRGFEARSGKAVFHSKDGHGGHIVG